MRRAESIWFSIRAKPWPSFSYTTCSTIPVGPEILELADSTGVSLGPDHGGDLS